MAVKKQIKNVGSLTGFINWATSLGEGGFLFRGQADASWPLRSGATRRVFPDPENEVVYSQVQFYMEELIERSRLRGFTQDKKDLHDLELLADLQHHGAASILLDLTRNSMIALWFACSDKAECDGKIFAINIQDIVNIRQVNSDNINKKLSFFLSQREAYIWEPGHINKRIPAQSSVFYIAREPYTIKQQTVIIKKEAKEKIRKQLRETLGITEESVFPDFPGFALANATSKPVALKNAEYYLGLARELQRADKFEEALTYYDKAIEINSDYQVAYFNRGLAKHNLKKYEEAIKDYDIAIKLDPNDTNAYNNMGNLKCAKETYDEAINDYNIAIKINPNFQLPYIGRGLAKRNLGFHTEAIQDFDLAIELDQDDPYAYNGRGITSIDLGDYIKAREDLLKAKALATETNNSSLLEMINHHIKRLEEKENKQ